MKAIVVLTPTESKRLIAEAVFQIPVVQNALKNGVLAIHPSSSTVFLYERILQEVPKGLWVCGVVGEKGLCGSMEAVAMIRGRGPGAHDPRKVSRETWVFVRGELQDQMPLGDILDMLGEEDVYVKGVNALDSRGNVGVLFSNPAGGGGTIGKVMAARRKKPFHVVFPVGLEKLIPGTIAEASRAVGFQKANQCMGIPAALLPVSGEKVDETDAFRLLFHVNASAISCGGLGGANGAVTLVLEGEEDAVQAAFAFACSVKGSQLPALSVPQEEGPYYPKFSL